MEFKWGGVALSEIIRFTILNLLEADSWKKEKKKNLYTKLKTPIELFPAWLIERVLYQRTVHSPVCLTEKVSVFKTNYVIKHGTYHWNK